MTDAWFTKVIIGLAFLLFISNTLPHYDNYYRFHKLFKLIYELLFEKCNELGCSITDYIESVIESSLEDEEPSENA
jgi:hypothetical protein